MSATIRILLVIAIIAYVIGRQVLGEALRGKRVVVLPVVLTVIGVVDLSHGAHPGTRDVALLVVNSMIAVVAGLALGRSMRITERDGYLWGQLPVRALSWWALLIAARLVSTGIADAMHAHLAASSSGVLLTLGINRLAQAAVLLPRAITAGVPFAPEKNGSSFLEGLSRPVAPQTPSRVPAFDAGGSRATPDRSDHAAIAWAQVTQRAQQFLEQRRGG